MNADGKIYIIVTDKLPAGAAPGPGEGGEKKEKSKEDLLEHWVRKKLLDEGKHLAMSAASYSINNIGNFTGNYQLQMQVQESLGLVKSFASIGLAAFAGFKYTGSPWGAVIGASIAVINKGIDIGTTAYSNYVTQRKNDYAIAQLERRSGLNQYTDGSRGTEN